MLQSDFSLMNHIKEYQNKENLPLNNENKNYILKRIASRYFQITSCHDTKRALKQKSEANLISSN